VKHLEHFNWDRFDDGTTYRECKFEDGATRYNKDGWNAEEFASRWSGGGSWIEQDGTEHHNSWDGISQHDENHNHIYSEHNHYSSYHNHEQERGGKHWHHSKDTKEKHESEGGNHHWDNHDHGDNGGDNGGDGGCDKGHIHTKAEEDEFNKKHDELADAVANENHEETSGVSAGGHYNAAGEWVDTSDVTTGEVITGGADGHFNENSGVWEEGTVQTSFDQDDCPADMVYEATSGLCVEMW